MTAGSVLGGVSYAAAVSAPGDLLYPVKASVASAYHAVEERVLPKTGPAPQGTPKDRAPSAGGRKADTPAVPAKSGKPEREESPAVKAPGQGSQGEGQGGQAQPRGQVKPKPDPQPKKKSPKKPNRGSGRGVGSQNAGRHPAASKQ
jgi:hypothetical protein